MEAATLPKKKGVKGKLRKTLKNVLSRPDPLFWPALTREESRKLMTVLANHKVHVLPRKRPHWNVIDRIPPLERRRERSLPNVPGLVFGLSAAFKMAIQHVYADDKAPLIVDASLNPRTLAKHIVQYCLPRQIPLVCLEGLSNISKELFGIRTSCLGITRDMVVIDIRNLVTQLGKKYYQIYQSTHPRKPEKIIPEPEMEIAEEIHIPCPYLYRDSKNYRVFNPPSVDTKSKKGFSGQDFIGFSDTEQNPKPKPKPNLYRTMAVNRVANNPNRRRRQDQ